MLKVSQGISATADRADTDMDRDVCAAINVMTLMTMAVVQLFPN